MARSDPIQLPGITGPTPALGIAGSHLGDSDIQPPSDTVSDVVRVRFSGLTVCVSLYQTPFAHSTEYSVEVVIITLPN